MLTCTNCGENIRALADQWGDVTIECSNISCGAQWDATGTVEFAGFAEVKK